MDRTATLKNIYDKKYISMTLSGHFAKAMGEPEYNGAWLVYGRDKNGKTWFSLKLADELSKIDRVLYISAEEGIAKAFRDTCLRVGLDSNNKRIHVLGYTSIEDLIIRLKRRKSQRIVFLDNLTIYKDELRGKCLTQLLTDFPDKLFVFLAHEERNEPYTAAAKLVHKLAKIIVRVKGLSAFVNGRCPGGELVIDEKRGKLYWGNEFLSNQIEEL